MFAGGCLAAEYLTSQGEDCVRRKGIQLYLSLFICLDGSQDL